MALSRGRAELIAFLNRWFAVVWRTDVGGQGYREPFAWAPREMTMTGKRGSSER